MHVYAAAVDVVASQATESSHATVMITGDSVVTAADVARQVSRISLMYTLLQIYMLCSAQ
jgi:magnesium-transporting ATPase (P-type)